MRFFSDLTNIAGGYVTILNIWLKPNSTTTITTKSPTTQPDPAINSTPINTAPVERYHKILILRSNS